MNRSEMGERKEEESCSLKKEKEGEREEIWRYEERRRKTDLLLLFLCSFFRNHQNRVQKFFLPIFNQDCVLSTH